jgi:hypothetical protein
LRWRKNAWQDDAGPEEPYMDSKLMSERGDHLKPKMEFKSAVEIAFVVDCCLHRETNI